LASVARTIVETMKSVISVNHASGFDLSDGDAVKIGQYFGPSTVAGPFVWVNPESIASSASSPQLGRYTRDLVVTAAGYIGATDDDSESRVVNALDLMHYVWTAVENDVRTTGGTLFATDDIIDVVAVGTAFDGGEMNIAPGMGVFYATFTFTYQTTRGL